MIVKYYFLGFSILHGVLFIESRRANKLYLASKEARDGRRRPEIRASEDFYEPKGCNPNDEVNCAFCHHQGDSCDWGCETGDTDKGWQAWTSWSECNVDTVDYCHRHRSRFRCKAICCEHIDFWSNNCMNCRSEMSDYEYDHCGMQCEPDHTHPQDDPLFCPCKDEYWGECCETDCPIPTYCEFYWCDYPPSTCTKCMNTTASAEAYLLENGLCYPQCNWLGHYCWPGECDEANNNLASTCSCIEGFTLSSGETYSHCLLEQTPSIESCRIGAESVNGESANGTSKDGLAACSSIEHTFINFKPDHMTFLFDFVFDELNYPNTTHDYISAWEFGVSEADVTIIKYTATGDEVPLFHHDMSALSANICTTAFSPDNLATEALLVSCEMNHGYGEIILELGDGELVCHRFNANGTGYVLIQDMMYTGKDPVSHPYDITTHTEERCFISDFTSPDHCLNIDTNCTDDVLTFGDRIRRSLNLSILFDGWFDPEPISDVASSSGIKEYEIDLRDVMYTPTELYADWNVIGSAKQNTTSLELSLPDRKQPHMFAIYLWVLDSTLESSNYQIARRFVLVDNSSFVDISEENPIIPVTANPEVNYKWQIVLDPVKLDWTNHFYNTWHVHTNLLLPIRREDNMTQPIEGVFEQETGELPVSGTPNVDGVVDFHYKYEHISENTTTKYDFQFVPNPLNQTLVIDNEVNDGDTFHVTIKAIDVMNNSLNEDITVYIDSSLPIIENAHLTKDGYELIFVHNSTDLSTMNMSFDAFDIHSGCKRILWSLGHEPGMSDVGSGALPVVRLNNDTCTPDLPCYCPRVGLCEFFNYTIPLHGLITNETDDGSHNREYHFTFEVMNEAHLTVVEQVVILADDSPPEIGHAFDGPVGSPDRDYQNELTIDFHWTGFIDHESGITKYHYGIGEQCYSKEQLQFLDNENTTDAFFYGETVNTFMRMNTSDLGMHKVSVIAFNAAMEPSESVCSSGVTVDISPPVVFEMSFSGARFTRSVLCHNNNDTIYALTENGVLNILFPAYECTSLCYNQTTFIDINKFPLAQSENGSVVLSDDQSIDFCTKYLTYRSDTPIYLASDNIQLFWNYSEPESQMLDFYVGLSTSGEVNAEPDLTGFISTHNLTQYKCYHCGLSQGDEIYINIRGINKASLFEHTIFGPVVIDVTPPVSTCNLQVNVDDDSVILSWPMNCFVDNEDTRVISDYTWALGTQHHKTEVIRWTNYTIPHSKLGTIELLEVTVNKSLLQVHDQDRGQSYIFTLHAFNRAGLFINQDSDEFQIHSKKLPSTGTVYHVAIDSSFDQIGFQENRDTLCVRWYGFVHHTDELSIYIGLGTAPYAYDIYHFENSSSSEHHCISGLELPPFQTYYATVKASNIEGFSLSSTHGIFVGNASEIVKHASIKLGHGCPKEFDNILFRRNDSSVVPDRTYSAFIPLTSFPERSLRITFLNATYDDISDLVVRINDVDYYLSSWTFTLDGIQSYHIFAHVQENITISFYGLNFESLLLKTVEIAIHECRATMYTIVADGISAQLSFNPLGQDGITHYEVSLESGSTNDTDFISIGYNTKFYMPFGLNDNMQYALNIRPCFSMTCLPAVTSPVFVVDKSPPESEFIEARLQKNPNNQLVSGDSFLLLATWDECGNGSYVVAYDYGVAMQVHGGRMVTPWTRVLALANTTRYEIEDVIKLPVYQYATLYFVLRCSNDAGLFSTHGTLIELQDPQSNDGIHVYDLSLDFNANMLNEYLHSQNIGNMTRVLHNADVDFSSSPEGIAGAVAGVSCPSFMWSLQIDVETNCFEIDNSKCIYRKASDFNTVRFSRMSLKSGMKYFACVTTSDVQCDTVSGCSNGFIVDLEAPLPGVIFIENIGENNFAVENSLAISWNRFTDLPENESAGYIEGIQQYEVSIGSAAGSDDVVPFQPVGMANHTVLTNLPLQSGRQYVASVRGCDHVDKCATATSSPFMVDMTAPVPGEIRVSMVQRGTFKKANDDIIVRLDNFKDQESGIVDIMLGIGTTNSSDDIMALESTSSEISVLKGQGLLTDGTLYFVHVQVTNRAGLYTRMSSDPFYFDSSPPDEGYVRFGSEQESMYYTRNTTDLTIHWGGFVDPHSGVIGYKVAVGTSPFSSNVAEWKSVGMQTDYIVDIDMKSGDTYYATVEACNGVMLCSTAVSHQLVVDDSPPVRGVVYVGYNAEHEQYQSNTQSLRVQWIGFHDEESAIQYYSICLVSSNVSHDLCNAHSGTKVVSGNDVILTGLSLRPRESYIAKVTARNNVHLCSQSTSKVFSIDNTPPEVLSNISLTTYSSLKPNTQFDRSYVSFMWNMMDNESPMVQYILSLTSHHDGEIPISNLKLGDVSSATISLTPNNHLKDGTLYSAKVVGCNSALLCTLSMTDNFLIDSSPPLLGGFVEPMFWNNTSKGAYLKLAWEGFVDPHSSISKYYVMVSSSYSGFDLSGGIVMVSHDDSAEIQRANVNLPGYHIESDIKVYLSIWAENGVGLTTYAAKASVLVVNDGHNVGRLAIEKHSCDVHYCTNDCTCAVVNQQCVDEVVSTCNEINMTDSNDLISVHDGLYGTEMRYSASSVCLPGYWISNFSDGDILRYEWSVSMFGYDAGFGILDINSDKIWFDVEMYDRAIFCHSANDTLSEGYSYNYHIRAWNGTNTYSLHKSLGVTIETSPPSIGMGRHVRDTDINFDEDIYFTSRLKGIFAEWQNVFLDAQSGIKRYMVAVGISPGGNEIYGPTDIGLRTNFSLPHVSLMSGAKYYTTVYAFNMLDMSTFDTSSGFVVDRESPSVGSVYAHVLLGNVVVSWVGFSDLDSHIIEYMYSVTVTGEEPSFVSTGFLTSITEHISEFQHGKRYTANVKAIDAAGHESAISSSKEFIVDFTPPLLKSCQRTQSIYKESLVCTCNPVVTHSPVDICECMANETFLSHPGYLYEVILTTQGAATHDLGRLDVGPHNDWVKFNHIGNKMFGYVTYFVALAEEDISPLFQSKAIFGNYTIEVSRCIDFPNSSNIFESVRIKQLGPLDIHIIHPFFDPESGVTNLQVGVGTTKSGFQLYPLQVVGERSTTYLELPLHHNLKVYATVIATNSIGAQTVVKSKPIIIDRVQPVVHNVTAIASNEGSGLYKIEAEWNATDRETPLTECFWTIGLHKNSDEVLEYAPTLTLQSSKIDSISLHHDDNVYVTVTCVNQLSYKGSGQAPPVTILAQPPSSAGATVDVIPKQYTYYVPREDSQIGGSEIAFRHTGFMDMPNVDYFQYMLHSGDAHTDWISVGKLDYLLLWGLNVNSPDMVEVFVRSVDANHVGSNPVSDTIWVDDSKPTLTGQTLDYNLYDTTMTVSWSDVFDIKLDHGSTLYQLYIGAEEAAADYVIGLDTKETELSFTSPKLTPPTTVHCVITAVTPAGASTMYYEIIYL